MEISAFTNDMQSSVCEFFEKCFAALGIPFSPSDRHADIADIEGYYMHCGCFWCLWDDSVLVGTEALRVMDAEDGVAELKRMSVLPEYQGRGCGRLLLNHAIGYAKEQRYSRICLDTRRELSAAQHLYRSSGFTEIERYNNNERAELFFELVL